MRIGGMLSLVHLGQVMVPCLLSLFSSKKVRSSAREKHHGGVFVSGWTRHEGHATLRGGREEWGWTVTQGRYRESTGSLPGSYWESKRVLSATGVGHCFAKESVCGVPKHR